MKRVIAMVVVLSLLVQCTVHIGLWSYYQVNKAYIAQNLCENRNLPQKKCCGKCYLRKQMKKVDESGSSSKKGQVKTERTEITEFIVSDITFNILTPMPLTSANNTPVYQDMFGNVAANGIFHPPSVVV